MKKYSSLLLSAALLTCVSVAAEKIVKGHAHGHNKPVEGMGDGFGTKRVPYHEKQAEHHEALAQHHKDQAEHHHRKAQEHKAEAAKEARKAGM